MDEEVIAADILICTKREESKWKVSGDMFASAV